MAYATTLESALSREGLATCKIERGAAHEFLCMFGDIIEETEVRQRGEAQTYLAGRGPVPLHTDHPEAGFVAWYCEVQDRQDGASVLTDGYSILHSMGAMARGLRNVELHVPPQLPRQILDRTKAWDGSRIYYAPWYPVVKANNDGRQALEVFENLLAMGFGYRRIRLKAGELLIVDNGRWLHGRDALSERSDRFLRRYWLRRRTHGINPETSGMVSAGPAS